MAVSIIRAQFRFRDTRESWRAFIRAGALYRSSAPPGSNMSRADCNVWFDSPRSE
jgi:hypothetical protein